MRLIRFAVIVACLAATPAMAQSRQTVTITLAAPVFVSPSDSQSPLRVAKEGSILLFLDAAGDWYHVEFNDPQYGRRVGYVQKRYGQLSDGERPPVPPVDAGVRDGAAEASNGTQFRPGANQNRGSYATDVFAGYSVLSDGDTTLPLGWVFSIGAKVSDSVAIVGEAGGGYKSVDVGALNLATLSVHNFVAGPRFYFPAGNAAIFAEALTGLTILHGTLFGLVGNSTTGIAIMPGGGVDIPVTRGIALRVGANFDAFRAVGSWNTAFRFNTGVRFATGRR